MSKNTGYYSVSRAQWHHIGFDAVHKIRAQQANQNGDAAKAADAAGMETAKQVERELVLED